MAEKLDVAVALYNLHGVKVAQTDDLRRLIVLLLSGEIKSANIITNDGCESVEAIRP